MNHEELDIASVDSERVAKSLRKYESCLEDLQEAKDELL